MGKKFRKKTSAKFLAIVRAKTTAVNNNQEGLIAKENEIPLTENDRIIYIYKLNKIRKMIEITTVSYVSLIKGEWITIVRYDNDPSHNVKLHVHITNSYQNRDDAPSWVNVRQKGSVRRLHTWAVEDLKNKFESYKKKFLKRSGFKDEDIDNRP